VRNVYRFNEIDWQLPDGLLADPDAVQAAGALGVARKHLIQDDTGFFVQIVRFPADFETPPHSHEHDEMFVVLEGSCVFDGQPMHEYDSTVVEANTSYGFTTGPQGMTLLVVRTGDVIVAP
jgi:quercetin dioxygenase-like cupin family protein